LRILQRYGISIRRLRRAGLDSGAFETPKPATRASPAMQCT